jgi:hypothetical protein
MPAPRASDALVPCQKRKKPGVYVAGPYFELPLVKYATFS